MLLVRACCAYAVTTANYETAAIRIRSVSCLGESQMTTSGEQSLQVSQDNTGHPRRWWVLSVLCIVLLIVVLDNTILNVALPSIQKDLHASQSQQEWMVDSYTLAFAGLLFTFGVLGDRLGRSGCSSSVLSCSAIGSIASAFADLARTC